MITVRDILDAMEKAGFENFQPEIENLLMGKINFDNFKYL
jgi:hypothetical protein